MLAKGLSIGQSTALADNDRDGRARGQVWGTYGERHRAVSRFDEQGLDDIYNAALGLHPIETVTQSLLLPVLRELGERWARRDGSVAEEHFFSVYLRSKLGARFHHRTRRSGVTRVLAACLPGEQHEIGLLIFALAAHERGFETVLLAANTPIEDFAAVVARSARRSCCRPPSSPSKKSSIGSCPRW